MKIKRLVIIMMVVKKQGKNREKRKSEEWKFEIMCIIKQIIPIK